MMLGDQLHTENNENTRFLGVESCQTTFCTHVLKIYINFQRKKKQTFKKNINKLTGNSAYKNIATLLRLKAEMLGKKVIK